MLCSAVDLHADSLEEKTNSHRVLVRNLQRKQTLGRSREILKYYTEMVLMDLKAIGSEDGMWLEFTNIMNSSLLLMLKLWFLRSKSLLN